MTLKKIKRYLAKRFIPTTLLKSNLLVGERERKRVLAEIEIERNWYKDAPGFKSYREIERKSREHILAKVTGNEDYLPILRLRNPELHSDYPPFLTKDAKELLDLIGQNWRTEMNKERLDPKIQLSITSLSRTVAYQKKLVKAGKLADPESVHTKGVAFDIDASGYYLNEVPINARSEQQSHFKNNFEKMAKPIEDQKFGDYSLYIPRVHQILREVLDEMKESGKLHFVREYPNTTNEVFHVCLNPNTK